MPPISRKLAAFRGFAWVIDGLAIARARPWPYLQLCLWFGLFAVTPVVNVLVVFLGGVFLQAGLVSALDAQGRGEVMRLRQLFDGVRQPGAFLRLLPIAVVKITFSLVALWLLSDAIGPDLMQMVRDNQTGELDAAQTRLLQDAAARVLQVMVLVAPLGVLVNWLVVLAVPQAMLGDIGGATALGRAFAAIVANPLVMLTNLVLVFAVTIVASLVLVVPAAMLIALVGPVSSLAALLQAVLFTSLIAWSVGLDGVVMWRAWRELFAAPDDPAAIAAASAPITQIEA
jgi:hypothetical protein